MKLRQIGQDEIEQVFNEGTEEISGLEFIEINFTEIKLKARIFNDCKFTQCNLSNVSLMNSSLRSIDFENSNLMGVNWVEARTGIQVAFRGCKLDYGCFQSIDLRGVEFRDCSIKEADFSGANLSKAIFSGSFLSETSFANVNVEGADFRRARNYFIDPKFAKLKGAKFSFPDGLVLIEALGCVIEM